MMCTKICLPSHHVYVYQSIAGYPINVYNGMCQLKIINLTRKMDDITVFFHNLEFIKMTLHA
jgi:hypothetical protein